MFTGQHAWLLLCHVTSRGIRESEIKINKKNSRVTHALSHSHRLRHRLKVFFFCLSVKLLDFLYFSGTSLLPWRRQSVLTSLTRPPILLPWKADFAQHKGNSTLCFLLVCIGMNNTQCLSQSVYCLSALCTRPISFSVRVSVVPLL